MLLSCKNPKTLSGIETCSAILSTFWVNIGKTTYNELELGLPERLLI
jgi:hypothetical protein